LLVVLQDENCDDYHKRGQCEAYAPMECPWGIGKNGKGPVVDGG
jgi:hypothetical protein